MGVGMLLGSHDMNTAVNWRLLGSIFVSWVVTIPFSGAVSALLFVICQPFVVAVMTVNTD